MAILRTGEMIGVCVHHSAYKPANNLTELKAQAKLFDGWHEDKSWAEKTKTKGEYGYQYVGYHYLMATDGSILQVQDEKYVLYHAGDNFRGVDSFNLHGIAICLTGNYETDKPTEAMMKSLVLFIRDVEKRYKIDAFVRVHKETSKTATACAGKNIGTSKSGWLKSVIANVNDKNYPPVEEPTPPPDQTEREKELAILKTENEELKKALSLSEDRVKKLEDDIKGYKAEIGVCHDELKASSDRMTELENLAKDLTNKNAEIIKELAEWKGEAIKKVLKEALEKIKDWFIKVWNR